MKHWNIDVSFVEVAASVFTKIMVSASLAKSALGAGSESPLKSPKREVTVIHWDCVAVPDFLIAGTTIKHQEFFYFYNCGHPSRFPIFSDCKSNLFFKLFLN